jgi:hypothetical protein
LATGQSLKVAQTQGAGFVMVTGEGFGVSHEFLEGHASLPDAVFEQGAWWPICQGSGSPLPAGGFVAGVWRFSVVSLIPPLVHDYFSSSPR